jgi:hypothetical protein
LSVLKKLRGFVISALVVVSGLTTATVPATAKAADGVSPMDVTIGWYRIRSINRPGECVQADPTVADPLMYVVPCSDSTYQRWLFGTTDPNYPDKYREVRNGSGRCMDADNRGGRLTGRLHLYTCNRSPNQAWFFAQPPSFGVACGYVANLCDWRPTQVATPTPGKGYEVFFQKTKDGGAAREWLLEPIS